MKICESASLKYRGPIGRVTAKGKPENGLLFVLQGICFNV